MTEQTRKTPRARARMRAFWRDLVMLTKPRIIVLLVITCLCAMLVATNGNMDLLSWQLIAHTCLGLALSAGGANAVNMWYDRDIDAVMMRTRNRPLPGGRMKPGFVLFYGIALGVVSTAYLALMVNLWTAAMALSGYLFYVLVYTFVLKRRTVQNIVIGGAAGAFPPLVGWAAVQNNVADWVPWVMFSIIFLWTPPHFWALALRKNTDYTKAGVPMLPVVKGETETKIQIVYYMLLLIPVTLWMTLLHPSFGPIYFCSAVVLGLVWLYKCVRLMRTQGTELAMDAFKFSLSYLALLFAAMVADTFL
ncbi:MAG: protoheme IX farnesyltransferase [Proteobacteria bacterium]|nr:protoheme IX farnesyltransferase [Pseudomonadota bacterium]